MSDQQNLKTLQLFYAGLMVDAAANFEHFGVSEGVTAKKAREQEIAAPGQLKQLGIGSPEALFTTLSSLFGCARWGVATTADGATTARTSSCLACAIARKRGAGRPCDLYCINPFRAFAKALPPGYTLSVEDTLWEGGECRFTLRRV